MRLDFISQFVPSVCFFAFTASQAQGNVVVEWNQEILNTIRVSKSAPPMAARAMAILHTSIYDAVNGIDRQNAAYYVTGSASGAASTEAAVIGAAYEAMVALYPARTAEYTALRDTQLAALPADPTVTNGLAWGGNVASQILTWRATDGAAEAASTPYVPGSDPGDWVPTHPGLLSPAFPGFGAVTPWTMTSGDQFRPPGPPALDSLQYAAELNEVKELGAIASLTRTADQTEIALFWADGPGTYTPPGHWNAIAQGFTSGMTVHESARLFAALNVSLADAAVAAWDAKYVDDLWRPITAIRMADTDGNPDTIADPTWTPLIVTPPFPEYVSGHSTFSAAGAAILGGLLGDHLSFSTQGDTDYDGTFDTTRNFMNFDHAAQEAGISRIYGGIHFESGNLDGYDVGLNIGNQVLGIYFQAVPEPTSPMLGLIGFLFLLRRRR